MIKHLFAVALGISLLIPQYVSAQDKDDLDKYLKHLKDDKAGPVNETGFLSAGSDFLYAQEYFDAKNYSSAEGYFMDAVKKQKDNAFANYQLAISLIRQNEPAKKQKAQEYLDAAFRLNPSLKDRYKKDAADTTFPINQKPTTNNTPSENEANTSKIAGLDAYIETIKNSRATAGAETAMNTAGLDAFYGIEYYEANEYSSAETRFNLALARDAKNPYINYLQAVSMAAQGKNETSKQYFQKAVATDPSLKDRFNKDVTKATGNWQKLVNSKKVNVSPPTKKIVGGKLVYGNYTCHQTVWNGPGTSPAYSFRYKGYFILKPDGTYRWLDNGLTGKYKYDAETGNITWLSGYFKTSDAKSTEYQINNETVQMTVNFTDSYRWECGCKKK